MYRTLVTTILLCGISTIADAAGGGGGCTYPGQASTCPAYTAPVSTALPSSSIGQTVPLTNSVPVTLFNGATPTNGFMVRFAAANVNCYVQDNGAVAAGSGFYVTGYNTAGEFTTPPGYKPMGPVSVICVGFNGTFNAEARAW